MTSRPVPGSAHAALDRLFEQCGGVKQAAHILNVDEFRLHHARNPNDERSISWARVCQLSREPGATAAAEHLAATAGGTFVPVQVERECLERLAARLAVEGGEGVAAMIRAKFEAVGRHTAVKELDDLIQVAVCARVVLASEPEPPNGGTVIPISSSGGSNAAAARGRA
jgi:hypothetical protein